MLFRSDLQRFVSEKRKLIALSTIFYTNMEFYSLNEFMKFQVHFNNGQSEICIHDHKGLVFHIGYFKEEAE